MRKELQECLDHSSNENKIAICIDYKTLNKEEATIDSGMPEEVKFQDQVIKQGEDLEKTIDSVQCADVLKEERARVIKDFPDQNDESVEVFHENELDF